MGNLFSICGVFSQRTDVFPFGGYFLRDMPLERGTFSGLLADEFGLANIKGIYLQDEEIEFMKSYTSREDGIDYRFKFYGEKGLWLGDYNGKNTGTGRAACEIYNFIKDMELERFFVRTEEQVKRMIDSMIEDGMLIETEDARTGEKLIRVSTNEDDDIPF